MQTLSFKHVLEQNKEQSQANNYLFTRLKQNISNAPSKESLKASSNEQALSVETIMRDCEMEFQILKLEKANQASIRFIETGTPLSEIIKEIDTQIAQQIEQIIRKKYQLGHEKTNKHLESTFHATDSHGKEKCSAKNSLTPKIYEFTLGNREPSSANSNQEQKHAGEEVSEFFVNSKGVASRNIRQKVMGQRKLK